MVLRKFFLFALIFFAAQSLWAQADGTGPSLEQVSAALARNKVTRGIFVLERTAANKSRSLKSSGTFVIAAACGIIWKTEKPIKAAQVMAKEFALTENSVGKRTRIRASENPVYLQMALLTSALWANDLAAVQGAADIDFSSEGDSWQMALFPKDAAVGAALEKIVVAGICGESQASVTKIQSFLKNGNSASYSLRGLSYGGSLTQEERSYFEIP